MLEPFVQFIVLGALICGAVGYWSAHHDRYIIHLGGAELQRIAMTPSAIWTIAHPAIQLRGQIDRYVHEEIVLREGVALHLEKDDEIVRRRIVQKYEFLQTNLAARRHTLLNTRFGRC